MGFLSPHGSWQWSPAVSVVGSLLNLSAFKIGGWVIPLTNSTALDQDFRVGEKQKQKHGGRGGVNILDKWHNTQTNLVGNYPRSLAPRWNWVHATSSPAGLSPCVPHVAHSLTHPFGFPPFLTSFLSPSLASRGHLPYRRQVPKSLTQVCSSQKIEDLIKDLIKDSICMPGSVLGTGDTKNE